MLAIGMPGRLRMRRCAGLAVVFVVGVGRIVLMRAWLAFPTQPGEGADTQDGRQYDGPCNVDSLDHEDSGMSPTAPKASDVGTGK